MMTLCKRVLNALAGKSLVTAESCTGGLIGSLLTAVPGSSSVYKGGVICYTNWVKENILSVPGYVLQQYGAVSCQTAQALAVGVLDKLQADIAVSVTGLAGPDGDGSDHPVGIVYIGYADKNTSLARKYVFSGNREQVRYAAAQEALNIILEMHH